MWNKLQQAAGLSSDSENVEAKDQTGVSEDMEQLEHQKLVIQQLKDLLRENDKKLADKENELQETTVKFQKFKLQSKAKISNLTSQIKEQDKPKKDDCEFDDASSTDSSDQSRRGKVLLLKKQLDQAKQQIEKKEVEIGNMCKQYEKKVNDLEAELNEKNVLISTIADKNFQDKSEQKNVPSTPKKDGSNLQEMYAQIVYKDSKILELNNQILENEKRIMDLQENIREKDEVLQQRNKAVQLITEDFNRKGMSVVNERDETRDQMKIMQENFAIAESNWKMEFESLNIKIEEYEKAAVEKNKSIKNNEEIIKNLEMVQHQLSQKNADLQKKVALAKENAAKQCELYQKETEIEIEALKKHLDVEKSRSAELQISLDEINSQSDNKVLKARVKERSKFKALEREIADLKKVIEEKGKEVIVFQQRIAELEEEKGTLQLKLMETEDNISLDDNMMKENQILKKTAEEAELKIQQFEKQFVVLNDEKCASETKYKSLREDFDQLQHDFYFKNQDSAERIDKLSHIEKNYETLQSEHLSIQTLYNETVKELDSFKDEKVTFELKVIELEEMREKEEKLKNELTFELQQLKQSMDNENNPVLKLENEKRGLEQKIIEIVSHCEELQEENNSLKNELEDNKQSYSKICEAKNNVDKEHCSTLDQLKMLEKHIEDNVLRLKEKEDHIESLNQESFYIQQERQQIYDVAAVQNLDDYLSKWAEITTHIEVLEKDNSKLKEEMSCLIKIKEQQQNKMEKMLSSNNQLECIANESKRNITELNNLLLNRDEYIKNCESEKSKFGEENKLLCDDLEKQTNSLIKLKSENNSLIKKVEQLENFQRLENEKVEGKVSSLLGQIDDLESEVSRLQDEAEKELSVTQCLKDQISLLHEEKFNIEEELGKELTICKDLESKINEYKLSGDALKGSLSNLQKENDELIVQAAKKDAEINHLNESVTRLELVTQNYQEKVNIASEKAVLAEKEVTSRTEQLHDLENQYIMLQEQKAHFNLLLSEKEEMCRSLSDEKQSLENELVKLTEKTHDTQLSLSNALTDLSNYKSLNSEFEAQVQDKEQKLSTLQATLEDVGQDNIHKLEGLLNTLDEIQKEKRNLEKKIHVLSSENSTLNEKIKEQVEVLDNAHKSYEILNENYKSTISSYDEQNILLNNMKEHLISFESEVAFLRTNKAEIEGKYSNLTVEFTSLNAKNESVTECLNTLETDYSQKISDLKAEISSVQENEFKAKSDIEALGIENKRISEQLQSVQEILVTKEDEINQVLQEIGTKESKISKLTEQINNYETEISNLQKTIQIANQNFHEEKSRVDCELKKALDKIITLQLSNDELNKSVKVLEVENQEILNKNLEDASSKNSLQQKIDDLGYKLLKKEDEMKDIHILLDQERREYETKLLSNNSENLKHLDDKYCSFMKYILNSFESSFGRLPFDPDWSKCESYEEFIQKILKDSKSMSDCILDYEIKIENMNLKIKGHENEIHLFKAQYETLKVDYNVCQTENCSLKSEYKNLENVISSVSSAVFRAIESSKEKFVSVIQSKCKTVSLLEEYVSKLKAIFISCQKELISLKKDKKILLKQMEDHKSMISELQNKSKYSEEENSQLTLQCREYSIQIQNLNENISLLQSSCADNVKEISEKLAKSSSELQILQQELHDKNNKLLMEENKLKISEDANLNLQSQLTSSVDEIERMSKEIQVQTETLAESCLSFENQIADLNSLISEKDDTISKMIQEQQNNNNALVCLRMELENSKSSFVESQSEISNLKRQRNEYLEQLQTLELSHNVSNVLQVEVENLRRELLNCEEQKNSLQQHLENMNSQIHSSVEEKQFLEDTITELQHELNNLKESNTALSNSVGEMKSLLNQKESEYKLTEEQNLRKCEQLVKEVESEKLAKEKLMTEKLQLVSKVDFELVENNMISYQNNLENVQLFLKNLKDFVLTVVIHSNYDASINPVENLEITDESLKQSITEFQNTIVCVLELKKNNEDLNNSLKTIMSENQNLLQEVESLKNASNLPDEKTHLKESLNVIEINKCITDIPDISSKVEHEVLCQSSNDTESENDSLKQELHSTKVRCAKMLAKLKLFKERSEKLQNELKEAKESNLKLHSLIEANEGLEIKITQANEAYNKLVQKSKFSAENHQLELVKSENILSQMKERNRSIEDECMAIRQELHQYKQSWNESMISFELQKEDNERLGVKLKDMTDELKNLTSKYKEQEAKLAQADQESFHLQQELQNMKEHANMLLSDNETYQNLIEKLKTSKIAIEHRLQETREKHAGEIRELEEKLKMEMDTEKGNINNDSAIEFLEKECFSLKNMCEELQKSNESLQRNNKSLQHQVKTLENNKFLVHEQLLQKNYETTLTEHSVKAVESVAVEADLQHSDKNIQLQHMENVRNSVQNVGVNVHELIEENKIIKTQLKDLTQQLHSSNTTLDHIKWQGMQNETAYKEEIQRLSEKIKLLQTNSVISEQNVNLHLEKESVKSQNLEIELQQVMNSMHRQGLRCEELSLEVSKLLEERNTLKWKLQQLQISDSKKIESNLVTSDKKLEVTVASDYSNFLDDQSGTLKLQEQLAQTVKTCQELRHINETLDQALRNERDQKRNIEEELLCANEQLMQSGIPTKDEFRLLLGDPEEPEMLTETNFSISREVKSHTHKIQRWLKGRRSYLSRIVKSRNYSHLLYLCYICILHIWLIACIFR